MILVVEIFKHFAIIVLAVRLTELHRSIIILHSLLEVVAIIIFFF